MARNRMITPEFWEDEKIGKLSVYAKLFFIGMWNFADDKGYIRNNPIVLKAKIFPYENIENSKIEMLVNELLSLKILEEKNRILKIKNFLKHQKIKNPSEKSLEKEYENQAEIENSTEKKDSPTEAVPPKEKLREVEVKRSKELPTSKPAEKDPAVCADKIFKEKTQKPKAQEVQDLKPKKLNPLQEFSNKVLEHFEPDIDFEDKTKRRIWFKRNARCLSDILRWNESDIDAALKTISNCIKKLNALNIHDFGYEAVVRNIQNYAPKRL
jgi:hypothetical protein